MTGDEDVIHLPDEAQPSAEELEQARRKEEARQAAWLADAPRLIAAFEEHRARALRNPATLAFLAAQQEPTTDDTPISLAWFDRALIEGQPAIGVQTRTTWGNIAQTIARTRRERDFKDGPCFVPSRFAPYYSGDDKHVRRQRKYVQARNLIALDIETSKKTGEAPPAPIEAVQRLQARGLAGVVYTSHSHTPADTRYRVVMPLSAEIPFDHAELPVAEIMAEHLGLAGVLDTSKIQGESAFYLPSCAVGALDQHQCIVVPGASIDADWLAATAGTLLAARLAEADCIATAAHAEAAARLQARIAAGFDPDDSLIEKLRSRFDLDSVLRSHGYDKAGSKYRHPNSESGVLRRRYQSPRRR